MSCGFWSQCLPHAIGPVHFKSASRDIKACSGNNIISSDTLMQQGVFLLCSDLFSLFKGFTTGGVLHSSALAGMIVEDPSLNQPSAEVVKMRPSQKKFRLQDGVQIQKKFGVVDYSKPYQFGALNKFTIIILSGLGVPLEIFQQRQEDFFRKWALAVDGQTEALMETLLLAKRPELLQELIAKDNVGRDLKPVREALRSELKKMSRQDANNQEPKLRIPIERSRLLFGVADTTDTLKYGECFGPVISNVFFPSYDWEMLNFSLGFA